MVETKVRQLFLNFKIAYLKTTIFQTEGALDVKLSPLFWMILLKHAAKMGSMVEFSDVASCAVLPIHAEVRLADHHMVVYRCRSADYFQRFGHHAIDIRAAVAVRCKIAYCAIEAVKITQKKMN
jgi:hypothetical protein